MTRLGRSLLWPAGLVVGLVAEQTGFGWDDPRSWAPDLVAGWVLISCGLVGWSRRPESRVGALTAATGFSWFLGNFVDADDGALAWIAAQAIFVYRGPLIHAVLGYPTGRASSQRDRAAVGVGYAAAVMAVVWRSDVATIVLGSLLVATSARGYAGASGRARHARLAALRAAAGLGLVLAAGAAARLALPSATTDELTLLALEATLCAVAIGLLIGLLSTSRERAVVTDLVVELGGSRSPTLRNELARALADPTLAVGYWSPSADAFVDPEGRAIELAAEGSGRAVTLVGDQKAPVAALVHDPALLDDPVLLDAAALSTRLAAKNDGLQAEVRFKLGELGASRRRIVEAADAEREHLERRLHDGAERLLEQLAAQLRTVRPGARSEASGSRISRAEAQLGDALAELRQLASGLHPRLLSDSGLEVALRSVANRSPVPVEVTVAVHGLSSQVEAAAYFVCSEALANVAKYAAASSASVSVTGRHGRVEVTIADDGGGGADPSRGTGLRGLADRVEALGGTVRIESEAGRGTRLTAEIPIGRA